MLPIERFPQHVSKDVWFYPSRKTLEFIAWHDPQATRRQIARFRVSAKLLRRVLCQMALQQGKARRMKRRRELKRRGSRVDR